MRKLFGRWRMPTTVLMIALIAVIAAGGIVAAASSYVLWQGSSNITVTEPITIYYGPDTGSCNTEIGLNDPMGSSIGLFPGECKDTWFKIINASPGDLLIKAAATTSDDSVVTVTFDSPDIATGGIVIDDSMPVFVLRTVCVNGTADPGVYAVTTEFTRESPPAP
jgi:hypothetical protein